MKYLDDSRPGDRWMKLHAQAGIESNAILAFEFTENNIHDINAYKPLIRSIRPLFNLQYITGGQGASIRRSLRMVQKQRHHSHYSGEEALG